MFISILGLSLVLAAPAPEPPDLPKGPAPIVMVLNVDKDGRPYLQAAVTITKMVPVPVTRVINGAPVVEVRQVPVTRTEQRRIFLDDEGVTVYDPDGKKLDPKKLSKQAGPAPVLVSADGKEVDPFYRPLARRGADHRGPGPGGGEARRNLPGAKASRFHAVEAMNGPVSRVERRPVLDVEAGVRRRLRRAGRGLVGRAAGTQNAV